MRYIFLLLNYCATSLVWPTFVLCVIKKFICTNICVTGKLGQVQLHLTNFGLYRRWYSSWSNIVYYPCPFIAKCAWTQSANIVACKNLVISINFCSYSNKNKIYIWLVQRIFSDPLWHESQSNVLLKTILLFSLNFRREHSKSLKTLSK